MMIPRCKRHLANLFSAYTMTILLGRVYFFPLIHSFNRESQSAYYTPGSVLRSGDKAENKIDRGSACLVFTLWCER